jgi:protein SERAC1
MNMLTPVGQTKSSRDALANIVFVHGIGSSSQTAWKSHESTEGGAFPDWLQDDLQRETRAPVNVWQVDYPAEVFRLIFQSVNRDDSVPQRSDMLRDVMLSHELTRRPVIFIAHSLGGILVKDMLRGSVDMRPYVPGGGATATAFSLALSTRLVVFISTPHDGASIANIAMLVPNCRGLHCSTSWG